MEYFIMMGLGIAIMIFTYFADRDLLRLDWNAVARFIGFMAFVTCIRIGLQDLTFTLNPSSMPSTDMIQNMGLFSFLLVFWEDAVYGITIAFAFKYLPKWLAVVAAVGISAHFAMGHTYQPWMSVAIISLVPYFGFYKFGIKYGFRTTMVCHIMYDMITALTVLYAPDIINKMYLYGTCSF